jgi:hypothetical protein
MARLIPSDFDPATSTDGTHASEARTLVRLRDGLSDRFTIYHGVHWARADHSGSAYGEIDFIIANPYGRLLAIEQKDTQIIATGTDLFARYSASRGSSQAGVLPGDKSITSQVNRNLNALRQQFDRRYPGGSLEIDHLLYLPTATLSGSLPSSVDPSRVVDAERDGDLLSVIESLLEDPPRDWSDEHLKGLQRIEDFLSQRVGAAPHIGLLGRSAREFTTRLAGGLSTWADRLSMSPWRLRVQGTAGSGKTQLALQALQQAHDAGLAAIYVCFNRPLADAMKRLALNPATVVTFHELARLALAQSGGSPVDFGQQGAFDTLAREFIALSPRLANTFDTLVIDEGQDFDPAWAQSLIGMAKPGARLLWLEDPEQSLYEREPVSLPDWVTLASPVNYRSPQRLVEFINWLTLTDDPVEAGSALVGFDPLWNVYNDGTSPIEATEEAISNLLQAGYSAANIAVLSLRGLASSQIAGEGGPSRLAGVRVKRQIGFDADGKTRWSDGELLVDTVFRFKGQAADAVLITEIDFSELALRERRRLFVALTRARLQVALVTSERAAEVLRARLA